MGFGKNNTGAIVREHQTQALGALGADTVIKIGGVSITEDFRILKSIVAAHCTGLTDREGAGLLLGIANGELSVTEIKECLEADGPVDRNDALGSEHAERQAHIVGQLDFQDAIAGVFKGEMGGSPITDKFRWTYSDPEGWDWFIYNSGPILTTGGSATVVATNYGVWVT